MQKAEKEIPAKYWVDMPAASGPEFDELFQNVRIQLRDSGAYDGQMLKAMFRIRCGQDPARPECAEKKE